MLYSFMKKAFFLLCGLLLLSIRKFEASHWLSKEVIEEIIEKFESEEIKRSLIIFRGHDRRSSSPFISGNGFRVNTSYFCDESNACRIHPEAITNGSCVFVKTDFFEFFVRDVSHRLGGSYKIISHNGDLSAPDGQDDAPRIGMPKYVVSNIMAREHQAGRLIAHHGQNLWWVNKTVSDRPIFSHCLPIGLENRQYSIGKNLTVYIEALRQNIVLTSPLTSTQMDQLPILLVAFYPKSRVPDRKNVLTKLHQSQSKTDPTTGQPAGKWYNETDLDHEGWLNSVGQHKFVLAPFGHGLDTHRITEILLMGGVPVVRRSTISSCYDDSDNIYVETDPTTGITRTHTRGSLPMVILDSWDDLTKDRLDKEWTRLAPLLRTTKWDWRRLFMDQWLERIGCS